MLGLPWVLLLLSGIRVARAYEDGAAVRTCISPIFGNRLDITTFCRPQPGDLVDPPKLVSKKQEAESMRVVHPVCQCGCCSGLLFVHCWN